VPTRVAINGFGRIGRIFARVLFIHGYTDQIELVAVNDLGDNPTLAHLFEFDSTYGRFPGSIELIEDDFIIDGHRVITLEEPDPSRLPWGELGIDIVLESTGKFRRKEDCEKHIQAGAKRAIISAPAKSEGVPTFVFGVNHTTFNPETDFVVSNASCTTNCLAPVIKVLNEQFGVKRGFMTTVHSITNDQPTLDQPHKDLRRARASAISIIPTTTGAAKAISQVMPELRNKIDGLALRVPTATVSVIDLVCELEKEISREEINEAFVKASQNELEGVLKVNDKLLVSVDYKGETASAVVDLTYTHVIGGNLVRVMAWYDNEWGYSCRCADLMLYIHKRELEYQKQKAKV